MIIRESEISSATFQSIRAAARKGGPRAALVEARRAFENSGAVEKVAKVAAILESTTARKTEAEIFAGVLFGRR